MTYEAALKKAWDELETSTGEKLLRARLFGEEYEADIKNRELRIVSLNAPANEYVAVLVLHYLAQKAAGLPALTGRWISFKELEGGTFYYSAYRQRAEWRLLRKCAGELEQLKQMAARLNAQPSTEGDLSFRIDTFPEVPILVIFWQGTDEFPPEVSMLFDSSIKDIFPTEEVAVLAGLAASSLGKK